MIDDGKAAHTPLDLDKPDDKLPIYIATDTLVYTHWQALVIVPLLRSHPR